MEIGQENSNSLRNRIIASLKERRNKILQGEINCIPLPFNRFRSELPGIEQGTYYLVSGSTKAGKSQISNYLFVYNTILYAYNNPNKVIPKIFYYNLEETAESITLRFMSYLLYTLDNYRVSPTDLRSTNENNPISEEVLELLNSAKYKSILNFYEECISFQTSRNPTGVWKDIKAYAENNGTTHYDIKIIKDEFGDDKQITKFNHYTPNNPNEYIFIIVDHVGLLESEKGLDLRQTINKLSEYMIIFRNRYNYIPVIVQQQSLETTSLDAFKQNKIRPTMAGLSDSKATGKDCTVMLGITNPYSFEIPEYLGYNIQKLRSNARFLEIVLNRNGQSNGICPLFFDGATNYFKELPLPNDVLGIEKVYKYLESLKKKIVTNFMSFSLGKLFNLINFAKH